MRPLLLLIVLAILAGCRIDPPGQGDVFAANQILFPRGEFIGRTELPERSRARAFEHLDRAIEAGHPSASSTKAFTVMVQDGQLAAEPHFRAVVEDENTTQHHRDQAYGMLWAIAHTRPQLEADIKTNDIPHGQHLRWVDVPGGLDVLREASAAGSAVADSFLTYRIDELRRQRDAGNADADSLLALLELATPDL